MRSRKRISLPKPTVVSGARDGSIALINVVFLLLVFLLVSGTARPLLPADFQWTTTSQQGAGGRPEGDFVVDRKGQIWSGDRLLSEADLDRMIAEAGGTAGNVTVLVDRRAKVGDLFALSELLRNNGKGTMTLITVEAVDE